ncbi:MAG: diguanylate cyclase [Gammaproteobacteria bacterium]|nr:diguanylate cyclase [Gammaproteobacteria bacterium]
MYFPNIESCATRNIERIDASESLARALQRMLECDLRDLVVDEPNGGLGIITIADILHARNRNPSLDMAISSIDLQPLPHVVEGSNVLDVVEQIDRGSDYLAVMNKQGGLTGIVSTSDILGCLDPQVMMERQQIGHLLIKNQLKVLPLSASVEEALNILESTSDAVVLWGNTSEDSGILTTKDALRLISLGVEGNEPAADHMSKPLITVSPQMTIKEAVSYLKNRHFHRLVVESDGVLLGLMTQQDLIGIAYSRWAELLRDHADELREVVSVLERRTAKLEQLASTDALTGAYNRSRFEKILHAEIERSSRYPMESACIILLDVDHFKSVNDRFGHDEGDAVLKQIVQAINVRLRSVDTLARWGGEEFIILLPHTLEQNAMRVADDIRQRLEEIEHPRGVGQVTASMGVAKLRSGESAEQLFRRVDRALYEAKKSGRNQVCVQSDP